MIGGDNYAALFGNVFYAREFNLPGDLTYGADNWPNYLEGPLRQHSATISRSRVLFGLEFAIVTQRLTSESDSARPSSSFTSGHHSGISFSVNVSGVQTLQTSHSKPS